MTQKVKKGDWQFKSAIQKILDKNVESIPYEGYEIDERGIIEDIFELISSKQYSLLRHTINKINNEQARF